jgi:hypothetical protein
MPAGAGTADKLLQELVDSEQRNDLPDYDVFEFRRSNGVRPPYTFHPPPAIVALLQLRVP